MLIRITSQLPLVSPSKKRNHEEQAVVTARTFEKGATRYAAALLATGIALLIRLLLNPFLGDHQPYIVLFPAVAFSALFCGIGPSVLAILVAVLGTSYWLIHPVHSFGMPANAQMLDALGFLCVSGILIAFGEMDRRTNERLRRTQEELEVQVRKHALQLDTAHQHVRDLTGQVLHLQDDERRRLARELHDSVGQSLAALAMNLSAVEGGVKADIERLTKTAAAVADSATLVREMTTEIRTISYLLHPPMLDEAGLLPALRWYIQGFAERSKIAVDLEASEDFERLPRDLETAIFRVVQECLTNIHRHSESSVAKIRIIRSASHVHVEVQDEGKGIPAEELSEMASMGTPGVGIRGMRERLHQLGGSLEIGSDGEGKGTVVVAVLPLTNSATHVAPPNEAAGARSEKISAHEA